MYPEVRTKYRCKNRKIKSINLIFDVFASSCSVKRMKFWSQILTERISLSVTSKKFIIFDRRTAIRLIYNNLMDILFKNVFSLSHALNVLKSNIIKHLSPICQNRYFYPIYYAMQHDFFEFIYIITKMPRPTG